jgi:hypothetical protein
MLTEAESASSPAVVVGMSAPPRTRLAPWQGARWPPPRHCARPDRRSGDRGLPSLPPPSCRRGAPLRRTLRSVLPGRSAPGTIEGAPDAPGPTNTRARAHHGQRPTSVPATRPTLPQVSSARVCHADGELIPSSVNPDPLPEAARALLWSVFRSSAAVSNGSEPKRGGIIRANQTCLSPSGARATLMLVGCARLGGPIGPPRAIAMRPTLPTGDVSRRCSRKRRDWSRLWSPSVAATRPARNGGAG